MDDTTLGWGNSVRSSGAGMIAFGTVSGGAGASLSGGNFWEGAVTGLIVSGLNHAMKHGTKNQTNDNKKGGVVQVEYSGNEDFDIENFNNVLKSELVSNGFSPNTIVEEYSFFKSIKYWLNGTPTATVNIRGFYTRNAPIDNGVAGYAKLASNSAIVYGGGSILGRYWDLDPIRLARVAVHELGHAIFSFNHSKSGLMFWQYGGGKMFGADPFRFNNIQFNIIKKSPWGQ